MEELVLEGKKYVSAKRAAKLTGYTKDYVGQLCRAGKLPAQMVGRNWYIEASSVSAKHKTIRQDIEQDGDLLNRQKHDVVGQRAGESIKKLTDTGGAKKTPQIPTIQSTQKSPRIFQVSKAPEVPLTSRYEPRTVEEAFPMRYEIDDRPLMPTPLRRKHAVIEVGSTSRTLPKEEKYQVAKAPIHQQHSAYVADARAVRKERLLGHSLQAHWYEKRTHHNERNTPTPAATISTKQDVPNIKHISRKPLFLLIASTALFIGALVYSSLVIQDARVYEQKMDGSYELRSRVLDWF